MRRLLRRPVQELPNFSDNNSRHVFQDGSFVLDCEFGQKLDSVALDFLGIVSELIHNDGESILSELDSVGHAH